MEGDIQGGIGVEDKEFLVLIELLMMQILKLDEIEAEGELKVQRKREVTESYLPKKSLFLLCFLPEDKRSNDVFEFLLTGLSCPEHCGIVRQTEGEKPRHEP